MNNKDTSESTKDRIIIKSAELNFKKNNYSEEFFKNYLSKADYGKIINEFNKQISQSFMTKRDNESIHLSPYAKTVMILSIVFTIVFIVLLSRSTSGDYEASTSNILYIFSIIFKFLILILIFVLSLSTYFSKIGKFNIIRRDHQNKFRSIPLYC